MIGGGTSLGRSRAWRPLALLRSELNRLARIPLARLIAWLIGLSPPRQPVENILRRCNLATTERWRLPALGCERFGLAGERERRSGARVRRERECLRVAVGLTVQILTVHIHLEMAICEWVARRWLGPRGLGSRGLGQAAPPRKRLELYGRSSSEDAHLPRHLLELPRALLAENELGATAHEDPRPPPHWRRLRLRVAP